MTRGFLLGKFLPPHLGHLHLCDFAQAYSDEVTVLVCSIAREPIPGRLRHEWMRELCPKARVLHCDWEVPQEPAEHPEFWPIWRNLIRHFHPELIDHVFASETYGHRLAEELGARFVPVDPPRLGVPVSGTAIRRDPAAVWRYLPAPVRPHFLRRVVLFGPESSGKTTLAAALGEALETVVVPEYGRTFTDAFGTDVPAEGLLAIARGHLASRAALSRQSNWVLVEDTDPVLTAVWSDMLTGRRDPWFDAFDDLADLYLLTAPDFGWVDDGTRYFPDQAQRDRFFALCRAELERRGARHVVLTGPHDRRLEDALATIRRLADR
ncbi:AAA family ATPase [Inquilinus sp. Marseille-Q2685]|uniref:AAA family ATPase n=1 Tax=Inquilinus sp. Marseille-Q2685 TaxID=2866581 RepID=UPI001CE4A233|nr:AAA family ATPase [Inquilinus sp. Marseille-Q2685]